jgi:MTH538 TIR-like domain (DUF1863)
MENKAPIYVVFDGDNDKWAYSYMKGWKSNENVEFDFRDAHDLDTMTASAANEQYVKGKLRERMNKSSVVVVLVGDKTKWLYKYVRWELELALELKIPIIAVSLAENRQIDSALLPSIIREECIIQVPFKMKAIRYALDSWPRTLLSLDTKERSAGPRHYTDETYRSLGL